jgi:uncharacterized protein YjbI with pentapeptide repeats
METSGPHFEDIDLSTTDFSRANLRSALFKNAILRACDFSNADLRSVVFLHCDLQGARLDGATLGANEFTGSCLAGVTGLDPDQTRYVIAKGGTFAYDLAHDWPPATD